MSPDAALAAVAELVGAVAVPVSADLEDCFADDPEGVAETVHLAAGAGVAGLSIEDWDGSGIRDHDSAVDRVAAAAEAARAAGVVLTARAENHIRGVDDLGDTVRRLQAYRDAGADVVFAPGLRTPEQIRAVVDAVDVPVNVLALPGVPPVGELAELGVGRVSVGGAFAFAAYGALADAAHELRSRGTWEYWEQAGRGRDATVAAFPPA